MKTDKQFTYWFSLVAIFLMAAWGLISPGTLGQCAGRTFDFLVMRLGWFYLVSVFSFLLFCIYIALSKYGKIKLGPEDSKPEFGYISWFAMLFGAGMAIGLIFWGVAEPLSHFISPPYDSAISGSPEAARLAFRYSFFHWGFSAWANYALFALAIAYFQQRKGYPCLVSSIFIPLIGEEKARGITGQCIDVLAIFATAAGIATDLGLGTLQINSGLNYMYKIPENIWVQIVIIIVVTILFMASAISGIHKGIKLLSDVNLWLSVLLMILTVYIGPAREIFVNMFIGMKDYLVNILQDSLPAAAFQGGSLWLGNWTVFYWAWWIAWTPFVGTFIARISRGRTIREFISGVLLVPSLGSILWFSIFGTMGIHAGASIGREAIRSISTAFFVIINTYPMAQIVSALAMVIIVIFFVTSADSSTFVLGIMSSKGDPNPTLKKKVTWGIIQSLLALALLLAGGLEVLQTANIVAAFPFAFIMIFSMVSLMKSLNAEYCDSKQRASRNEGSVSRGNAIEE